MSLSIENVQLTHLDTLVREVAIILANLVSTARIR